MNRGIRLGTRLFELRAELKSTCDYAGAVAICETAGADALAPVFGTMRMSSGMLAWHGCSCKARLLQRRMLGQSKPLCKPARNVYKVCLTVDNALRGAHHAGTGQGGGGGDSSDGGAVVDMVAKWHSDQQLTRCRVTHLQVKAAAVATRVMAEQRGTPAQSPSVSVTRSGTTINVRPRNSLPT